MHDIVELNESTTGDEPLCPLTEPHEIIKNFTHSPVLHHDPNEGKFSRHVQISKEVIAHGTYNRFGARIPVNEKWNLDLLQELLEGYHDAEVVEWLKFGWPINRSPELPDPVLDVRNHKGATDFQQEVDEYIKKEIKLGAMFGPFLTIPWDKRVGISPLHSRPRRNSERRRVLLDLSWPRSGGAVNDGIPSDSYLGKPMRIHYPSVDTLANRIADLHQRNPSETIQIYGFDMHRAYRQLNLDPFDYPLIGMYWKGLFFWDCHSPMGLRSASMFCQRTTNSICYIHQKQGYWLMAYQDDLNGAETQSTAEDAFNSLLKLLNDLNIDLSHEKTIKPTTCAEVLGVWFDTILQIIAVTPDRIVDSLRLLDMWRFKQYATKTELQSIIGKLQFMAKCVRPGRVFISRLLTQLRKLGHNNVFEISQEVKMDLKFWYEFLPKFNGVSVMRCIDTGVPGVEIASDCNLIACGAFCQGEYFHNKFPEEILDTTSNISERELLTVIVSLKVWGSKIKGKKIYFHCDNEAAVACVNSGRAKNLFMQQCLREIVYLCATGEFEVKLTHISSADNCIPDALSRWYDGSEFRRKFRRLTQGMKVTQRRLNLTHFKWSCEW